jgi:hypothetical protein
MLAGKVAASQSLEPRRFAVILMCRPHAVVHKSAFDGN